MKTIDEEIKASKFTSPSHKALVNLFYTYFRLYNSQQVYFLDFGLQPQHYNVLRIIKGKYPEPVTPGHIIGSMLDKKRDLTRLIDKLEILGLVTRSKSVVNKRIMLISLTQEGLDIYDKITGGLDEVITHGLNEEESEQLSSLLDKMRCKSLVKTKSSK